jgi:hypothetical protein
MAKIPKNPEEIFPAMTDDFKKIFGNDLLSIILHGSGARGEYIPGKSDINFLIVLSQAGIRYIDKAIAMLGQWRKRNVAIPLFMTKEEILSSLDSYPVEFLTMKENHGLVYGSDILSTLSIEYGPLRLQCERELKGKIFNLRSGLIETEGNAKRIRELIKVSLNAFISVFKALLYLKAINIPKGRRDVIQAVAAAYSIDPDVFFRCVDIKEGIDAIAASDIPAVFAIYLKEIEKLSQVVDGLKI